jgi:primosomal protein N' (replication factor Y)
LFPQARIALASSDTVSTPKKVQQLMQEIQDGHISLIVGTKILAKGHHFPNLTCVGVVDADYALASEDIRAREYAFQLLHQVAGRAGRAEKPGHVFLQEEGRWRQAAQMPPFTRLVALIFSGLNAENVAQAAQVFVQQAPRAEAIDILGPIPAPLSYLRGRYRWRALVRAPRSRSLAGFLEKWRAQAPLPKTCRLEIDVDPMSFL